MYAEDGRLTPKYYAALWCYMFMQNFKKIQLAGFMCLTESLLVLTSVIGSCQMKNWPVGENFQVIKLGRKMEGKFILT